MSNEKRPFMDGITLEALEAEIEEPREVEQDAPLTKEQFAAQMQRLNERARAAGLKPLQLMAQTYAKLGMAMLEGVLASLESDDSPKKKA